MMTVEEMIKELLDKQKKKGKNPTKLVLTKKTFAILLDEIGLPKEFSPEEAQHTDAFWVRGFDSLQPILLDIDEPIVIVG